MTPANKFRRFLLSPYLLLLLPCLFWAGNAVIARASVGLVPPIGLAFWRWTLALILLLPFGLPRLWPKRHLIRRHFGVLAALAATSVAAYNTLLYLALQTTTAINATLVAAALPIVTIGLSWGLLGEGITRRQAVGVLVSLGGVLVVISQGQAAVLLGLELRRGDLWVLLATLIWAFYSVLLRRHPLPFDAIGLLTLLVAIGTAMILPFHLWELSTGADFAWNWETAAIVGYVGIFPSILALYFWNQGVAALGANVAGQYSNVVPVFTAVLATLFLGESFRWYHTLGLVLIFAGIWLATRPTRRA